MNLTTKRVVLFLN